MAKILVIDDDKSINELIKVNLELAYYKVVCAFDGNKGYALCKQELPDLVVLDIMMPDVDGYTVAKRIRENESTKDIPIIMLTALNMLQDKVQGFNIAISTLAKVGESILVLTPTYYPMFAGIKNQGCQIVESNLIYDDKTCRYTIDYEDVAKKAKNPNLTVALIGNPHNPTGRLYSVEELSKLADILIENNVKIICDDIHCDIIVDPSKKYTPLASIEKYANHIISMNAPSKTFNLAGAKVSNVIIQNEEINRAYKFQMERFCVSVSTFSLAACKTAYSKCAYWVDEMKKYVWGNYNYVKDYIENSILKDYIKAVPLEGSYLMFADNKNLMKEFNMSQEDLKNFYYDSCNLSLDDGDAFGNAGIGFMRFNLATQRYYVEKAMNNIAEAVKNLKK